VDATNGGIGELTEGSRGEIDVPKAGATSASVGNGNSDRTALVVGGQSPATNGVAVQGMSMSIHHG
jgi:hypothetical protein